MQRNDRLSPPSPSIYAVLRASDECLSTFCGGLLRPQVADTKNEEDLRVKAAETSSLQSAFHPDPSVFRVQIAHWGPGFLGQEIQYSWLLPVASATLPSI